jgi:hypothetical protein
LSSPHVLTIIAIGCGAWWHWWALEGRVAVGTEEIEISHKTAKSEIAKKKQKLVDRGITHGWCSGSNISAPGHGRDLPDRKPVRAGQPVQTKSQCACAPKSFSNPTHWQPSLRPQSAVSHCSGPLSKFITVKYVQPISISQCNGGNYTLPVIHKTQQIRYKMRQRIDARIQ